MILDGLLLFSGVPGTGDLPTTGTPELYQRPRPWYNGLPVFRLRWWRSRYRHRR